MSHLPATTVDEDTLPDSILASRTVQHDAYQPLDRERKEIRLLVLKAGSRPTEIECELQQAFLTSVPQPRYETISYCWGDPTQRTTIWLNGGRVEVPFSAEAALRTMRLPDTDRVLWIDAICIDQDNLEERGHQVSIMYEVYSQNQRNLVYLGEDERTAIKAMEVVEAILENARAETDQYRTWHTITRYPSGAQKISETRLGLDLDLTPLIHFFSGFPWFGRLWVSLYSYSIVHKEKL